MPPKLHAGDVIGGVSVAMVLIPQSLAYAGLAGVPPYVGLFASAFPLVVFALLASSPYLQTGPVALTSLLTAGALASTEASPESVEYVELAAVLAVIVGVVRVGIGLTRLGSVVYLMAEPVMIGFTSAAGLVILSSQLPRAFGVDTTVLPDTDNPIGRAAWAVVHPEEWESASLVLSGLTLVTMLQGKRVHHLFPGVLAAVVVAIAYSEITGYGGAIVGEIDAGLPSMSFDLPWDSVGKLVVGGVVIALVGFAEPASIARTFANEDHSRWSSSREFVASGVANTVSGLSGAFPVGGSFSRSSVNRFAGARTRWSGFVTGIVIIGFLPFSGMLRALPQAVLGAIVVGAVLSLLKFSRLVRLSRRSRWQAGLAWVTWVATVLTPPHVERAVIVGVGLTIVHHVARPFRLESRSENGELVIEARGLLWIATNRRLRDDLESTIADDRGVGPVSLDLGRTTAIDGAIAESIAAGAELAERRGRAFRVRNPPDGGRAILDSFGVPVE